MRLAIKKKFFFILIVFFFGFFLLRRFPFIPSLLWGASDFVISPLGSKKAGPLLKYSFENLRKRSYQSNPIKIDRIIKKDDKFTSYLFFYESDGKKISGLLNLPSGKMPVKGWPVIIMLRGYVDEEIYYTGIGTEKAGQYFAKNGFVTLAPDFLGFGYSDPIDTPDILEDRFQKPIEVLNLLASLKKISCEEKGVSSLKKATSLPAESQSRGGLIDSKKTFMWAHSNGGQIALSVLEITKQSIPTVLWAPVTKGFPESLLVYMHELDDNGKRVKAALDKFTLDYEASNYSITTYLKDIKVPLEVHQGTWDELVDEAWTSEFVHKMRSFGKSVEYYTYPDADHNLSGGKIEENSDHEIDKSTDNSVDSWASAVSRSLDFYRQF